jgi:hypothetical protein
MSDDIHKYPSQVADRFQVRMPDGLRDRIADAAKKAGRSMNTEIVSRLEKSFTAISEASAVEVMEALRRIVMEDPISLALVEDVSLIDALNKFSDESGIHRSEALAAAFRDWAIGHGYLELPPDREDAN